MRIRAVTVLFAAMLFSSIAGADPVLAIDDPMTQPFAAGQTVKGGTFAASGWTRDSFEAQIIYDVGAPIVAGRLIFEMNGVNGVNHGVGGFPDCRAIFAALDDNGSGNIDDVGNENVQYLWAWAMEETDYCNGAPGGIERTNRMKLLVFTHSPNNPGEPMSDPLVWDETQFYTYEIGWDHDHAWLLRDGVTVLDQIYPVPPITMNMRYVFIGTVNRYKAGVKNATYRNLKLWNDAPSVVSDAGSDVDASENPIDAAADGGFTNPTIDSGKLEGGAGTVGVPKGTTDPADSGCGCRSARPTPTPSLPLALGSIALGLVVARRKRGVTRSALCARAGCTPIPRRPRTRRV